MMHDINEKLENNLWNSFWSGYDIDVSIRPKIAGVIAVCLEDGLTLSITGYLWHSTDTTAEALNKR